MNNIGITEGMGKKIVEALKMQTEMGVPAQEPATIQVPFEESSSEIEYVEPQIMPEEPVIQPQANVMDETFVAPQETFIPNASVFNKPVQQPVMSEQHLQQPQFTQPMMNFTTAADTADMEIDMPTNVAVLRNLITQLPTGVTKQTGAQIIKQTMEALGISMKSVLQEAQQVQESLNNSSRECQANIIEYKRQISLLEKQSQQYQKQYAILNDIISLFIQTNNY